MATDSMKLNLSVDEVLSTTRSVRRRLDISKRVPRALIEECLELALQAPNGSNQNTWRWIVLDDPAIIAQVAAQYIEVVKSMTHVFQAKNVGVPGEEKVIDSALAFLDTIDKVPAMLIPLIPGKLDGKPLVEQSAKWGSIVQAGMELLFSSSRTRTRFRMDYSFSIARERDRTNSRYSSRSLYSSRTISHSLYDWHRLQKGMEKARQ